MRMQPGFLIITLITGALVSFSCRDSFPLYGREAVKVAEQPAVQDQTEHGGNRTNAPEPAGTAPEKEPSIPETQPPEQINNESPLPENPPADLFYSYPDELKTITGESYDLACAAEKFG